MSDYLVEAIKAMAARYGAQAGQAAEMADAYPDDDGAETEVAIYTNVAAELRRMLTVNDERLAARAESAGVDPVIYASEYRSASAAYGEIG